MTRAVLCDDEGVLKYGSWIGTVPVLVGRILVPFPCRLFFHSRSFARHVLTTSLCVGANSF